MKWNPSHIYPPRQGTYLCYGNEYTPLSDKSGVYYLADFVYGPSFEIEQARWIEKVPNYHDMILKYWCELPDQPTKDKE